VSLFLGSSPAAVRVSQRGAAVFVVVLVVTLLSALGLFALRSATLTNLSAGYSRQMMQTHYMSEYAMTLMAAELGGPARQNYADEMWSGKHVAECVGGAGGGALSNSTCYPVFYTDVESRVQGYNSDSELLDPAVEPGSGGALPTDGTPGSLGPAPLEGDFRAELTDIHESVPPIEGMDLTGSSSTPRYYSVTMTVTSQVRPQTAADRTTCDDVARAAAGVEAARAHVVVGPLSH
jgi:hypothetical protein